MLFCFPLLFLIYTLVYVIFSYVHCSLRGDKKNQIVIFSDYEDEETKEEVEEESFPVMKKGKDMAYVFFYDYVMFFYTLTMFLFLSMIVRLFREVIKAKK